MGEKHTPTPWGLCYHLRSPEHDASCPCGYRGSIWSADGEYIVCEMGSSPDVDEKGQVQGHIQPMADRPTQLADAAFIVRAVNAHDDLVEAVRRAEATFELMAAAAYQVGLEGSKEWDEVAGKSDLHGTHDLIRATLSRHGEGK